MKKFLGILFALFLLFWRTPAHAQPSLSQSWLSGVSTFIPPDAGGSVISVDGEIFVDNNNWLQETNGTSWITSSNFWEALNASCNDPSGATTPCNNDPRMFWDSPEGEGVAIAEPVANNEVPLTNTTIYLYAAGYEYSINNACSLISGYPYTDLPILSVDSNWIVIETRCFTSSDQFGGQEIHAIEKAAAYSGSYTSSNDHPFVSTGGPGKGMDAVLADVADNDAAAYFARILPGTGTTTVYFSKITGPVTAPTYTPNFASSTVEVEASGGKGQNCMSAPNGPQAGGTYELGGLGYNAVQASGDEDVWGAYCTKPAGDHVLELIWNQQVGGVANGKTGHCSGYNGGIWTQYWTYDLTLANTATAMALSGDVAGKCEWLYPSAAHGMFGGYDYFVWNLTYAATTGSGCGGSAYSPTAEVLWYGPVTQASSCAPANPVDGTYRVSASDVPGPYPARWGDFSTISEDPNTGYLWFWSDLYNTGYTNWLGVLK